MTDWDQIIRRDGPAVWRTVCRLVGDRADAEECFQEAFVAALELARREPLTSPRALLLRMATARAMDRLRQRYRRRKRESADAELDYVPSQQTTAHEHAEASELSQRLREALATLPPKQSDAFCLCCLEGWSYQEAADHLEVSSQNVGVMVHRARTKLKELLEPMKERKQVGTSG
jgi:RNA polymerase sigma factor (sigma-70 family)